MDFGGSRARKKPLSSRMWLIVGLTVGLASALIAVVALLPEPVGIMKLQTAPLKVIPATLFALGWMGLTVLSLRSGIYGRSAGGPKFGLLYIGFPPSAVVAILSYLALDHLVYGLDRSPAHTTIDRIVAQTSIGRHNYVFAVRPGAGARLDLKPELYNAVRLNGPLCIDRHDGMFGMAWVLPRVCTTDEAARMPPRDGSSGDAPEGWAFDKPVP